jgi:hypothetical protein
VKLTGDQFMKSNQMMLKTLEGYIGSVESQGGNSPSDSPIGRKTNPSGQPPAPASRSLAQEKLEEFSTSGTYGQLFNASSPSATLQRSLENRLRARLAGRGSPEYATVWKEWDMPSGVPICALRASGRRISDNGYTGWQTPQAMDANGQGRPGRLKKDGNRDPNLPGSYRWDLKDQAILAGWTTPNARDWKDSPGMATTGINPDGSIRTKLDQLPRQVFGLIPSSSPAQTANPAASPVLNPFFVAWIMGYNSLWTLAGLLAATRSAHPSKASPASSEATETASSQNSPPNLSQPSLKP